MPRSSRVDNNRKKSHKNLNVTLKRGVKRTLSPAEKAELERERRRRNHPLPNRNAESPRNLSKSIAQLQTRIIDILKRKSGKTDSRPTLDQILKNGEIEEIAVLTDNSIFVTVREVSPQKGKEILRVAPVQSKINTYGVDSEEFKAISDSLKSKKHHLVFDANFIDQHAVNTKVDLHVGPGIRYVSSNGVIDLILRGTTICKIREITAPTPDGPPVLGGGK